MPKLTRIISLDSETCGLDLWHGAKPYLVTICDESGNNTFWEWDVDPLTREPQIPYNDMCEVLEIIEQADFIVTQNGKFDAHALKTVDCLSTWNWDKVHDTLIAGHLLASNQPHDLTTMAITYLGVNIQPYEDALKVACEEARRYARKNFPNWRIAKAGLSDMPSAKEKVWKNDAWLPRAIAKAEGYPPNHPWWTVTSNYANGDSIEKVMPSTSGPFHSGSVLGVFTPFVACFNF